MLIDTHAHLDYQQYQPDLEEVLQRAEGAGVGKIINVGTNLESSWKAVALAEKYPQVYAAVGIYPHEEPKYQTGGEIGELVYKLETALLNTLPACAGGKGRISLNPAVAGQAGQKIRPTCAGRPSRESYPPVLVAIGECGLDFAKLDQTDRELGMNLRPKEQQQTLFEKQIELAQKLDLPLIVHSREAAQETYQTLVEKGVRRAVIHCFTYDWEWAQKFLDQGYYLSFTGIITFPKTTELQEVVAKTPLGRILAETDCPHLAPVPHRGQRNEPAWVRYVYEKIAEVKGIVQLKVEEQIRENVRGVFKI